MNPDWKAAAMQPQEFLHFAHIVRHMMEEVVHSHLVPSMAAVLLARVVLMDRV